MEGWGEAGKKDHKEPIQTQQCLDHPQEGPRTSWWPPHLTRQSVLDICDLPGAPSREPHYCGGREQVLGAGSQCPPVMEPRHREGKLFTNGVRAGEGRAYWRPQGGRVI